MTRGVGQSRTSRKPRSRLLRGVYLVLGLICLGFATISFLPGIPTFDFVVLAAFFFSMSSDRLHSWLVNHPVYGKMIRGYRSGGLTMRMKWVAAIAITLSLSFSALVMVDNTVLRVVLAAVGVFAVWFVFTRPTRTGDDLTEGAPDFSPR
ncbi:MAG TPA: YbaN family protein [Acidimicrobiia bacterium]|nr:YbaN family protein [Acidimicrobiia bacterium]